MKRKLPLLSKEVLDKAYLLSDNLEKNVVEQVFYATFLSFLNTLVEGEPFNIPYFGQVSVKDGSVIFDPHPVLNTVAKSDKEELAVFLKKVATDRISTSLDKILQQ